MGKVQTYRDLASFFRNASGFLLGAEFENNLFWEVIQKLQESRKSPWSGNVFHKGEICLSSLILPSGFLLLSNGNKDALIRLAHYGKSKKWKIQGVTGPEKSVLSFASAWLEGVKEAPLDKKEFMIYSTSCFSFLKGRKPPLLKVVEPSSWPRAQAWTNLYANESDPPLESSTLVSMTRSMMLKGNLFLLHKEGVGACAMGGFGRATPRSFVINEVFVPKELRGRGYGKELISGLVGQAAAKGKTDCILFSDYSGPNNLYDRLGFKKIVKFCEQSF